MPHPSPTAAYGHIHDYHCFKRIMDNHSEHQSQVNDYSLASKVPLDFHPPLPKRGSEGEEAGPRNSSHTNAERCVFVSKVEYEFVGEASALDVLCGRGAPISAHPGNQFFRDLVRKQQDNYMISKRHEKVQVAEYIFQVIRSRGGRFLKQTIAGDWIVVRDSVAYEKIRQALREGRSQRRASSKISHNPGSREARDERQCQM